MGFIYKITNIITNKCYIGQTKQKDPQYRWNDHIRSMKTGINGSPLLIASAKKYGVECFKFEVLIICFDEDLNKYEKEYIKKINTQVPNGYNITDGGEIHNTFKNRKHTEETKQKIREINLKRFQDSNELAKHSISIQKFYDNGGMEKSEKWQAYLKKINSGELKLKKEPLSNDTKNKLSNIVTEYFKNNINRQKHSTIMTKINGKIVIQLDKDNTILNSYDSITIASSITGVGRASISSCINGRTNTAGGYIWKLNNL